MSSVMRIKDTLDQCQMYKFLVNVYLGVIVANMQ